MYRNAVASLNKQTLIVSLRSWTILALALIIAASAGCSSSTTTTTLDGGQPLGASPPYNPYQSNILPPDLLTEIERVQREVNGLFQQAIGEWMAMPPLTSTGQPPILQGSGYNSVITLGKLMNFDETISPYKNRACAFCHMPYAGFSGPIPSVNLTMIAYPGSYSYRAGKRTAQRYTYSPSFPVLAYNQGQNNFFGGNFWDGRATGYLLQNPDAQQAQHPPVDQLEMAFPDTACVAYRLSQAQYRPLFEGIWGPGSLTISWPSNTEQICDTPGGLRCSARTHSQSS